MTRTPPSIARVIRLVIAGLGLAVCLLGTQIPASAQTLSLSLSRTTIPFTASDPDVAPVVTAPVVTVTYRVRGNTGRNWQITLLASGDLSSGFASIPVSNVTWAATPSPFQPGTMNASVAQRLAGGTGNIDPSRTGQVTFALANSWSYDVGTYSATFTFTLVAP